MVEQRRLHLHRVDAGVPKPDVDCLAERLRKQRVRVADNTAQIDYLRRQCLTPSEGIVRSTKSSQGLLNQSHSLSVPDRQIAL